MDVMRRALHSGVFLPKAHNSSLIMRNIRQPETRDMLQYLTSILQEYQGHEQQGRETVTDQTKDMRQLNAVGTLGGTLDGTAGRTMGGILGGILGGTLGHTKWENWRKPNKSKV